MNPNKASFLHIVGIFYLFVMHLPASAETVKFSCTLLKKNDVYSIGPKVFDTVTVDYDNNTIKFTGTVEGFYRDGKPLREDFYIGNDPNYKHPTDMLRINRNGPKVFTAIAFRSEYPFMIDLNRRGELIISSLSFQTSGYDVAIQWHDCF